MRASQRAMRACACPLNVHMYVTDIVNVKREENMEGFGMWCIAANTPRLDVDKVFPLNERPDGYLVNEGALN